MEKKKIKKRHLSIRVEENAIKNCIDISNRLKWTLSSVIEESMRRIKIEELLKEINSSQ